MKNGGFDTLLFMDNKIRSLKYRETTPSGSFDYEGQRRRTLWERDARGWTEWELKKSRDEFMVKSPYRTYWCNLFVVGKVSDRQGMRRNKKITLYNGEQHNRNKTSGGQVKDRERWSYILVFLSLNRKNTWRGSRRESCLRPWNIWKPLMETIHTYTSYRMNMF